MEVLNLTKMSLLYASHELNFASDPKVYSCDKYDDQDECIVNVYVGRYSCRNKVIWLDKIEIFQTKLFIKKNIC